MMIGRQQLDISPFAFMRLLNRFQFLCDEKLAHHILHDNMGFAEPLFRFLGAENVSSLDLSVYENATHIHDMNMPISANLHKRYSVVFDGGTLEHIFNFPTAIQNCMEMVCDKGHFVGITPANNLMGHGYYQFSPDLYFSIFSEANGFQVEEILLSESAFGSKFYEVANPLETGCRVELRNNRQVYMFVRAKRIAEIPILSVLPLQMYYETKWRQERSSTPSESARPPLSSWELRLRGWVPARVKNFLLSFRDLIWPPLRKSTAFREKE